MNKLYIIEIAIAIALLLFFLVFFIARKNKCKSVVKSYSKAAIPILLIAVIGIGAQYIFERPQIDIANLNVVEVFSKEKLENPKAMYHNEDITNKVEVIGEVDFSKIGKYEVEYKIPYLNSYITQKQTIEIVDKQAPIIELVGEEIYSQSYKKDYTEPGYKATDNYDGDLTPKVTSEKEDITEKQYIMHYKVSDSSGNEATKERTVNIVDDIAPEITLNNDANNVLYVGETFTDKGATAKDEIDGDLTSKLQKEGSVDTSKEGTYKITYSVTDNSGNVGKATITVTVISKTSVNTGISSPGVIYLTFDDGPSTDITPKILDILKQKNVKATFFILNYSDSKEYLVKREVEEGHTVGIHGYSHVYRDIYKSESAFMDNITKLRAKVKASTGYDSTIIRFPGGSSNAVSKFNPGVMTRLTKLVVAEGYKYFDWNVGSGDAGDVKTTEGVYNNVTRNLSKSKANVVLMHDFGGNTKTLNALANIIDYGKKNGYTFDRITQATAMVTHRLNN